MTPPSCRPSSRPSYWTELSLSALPPFKCLILMQSVTHNTTTNVQWMFFPVTSCLGYMNSNLVASGRPKCKPTLATAKAAYMATRNFTHAQQISDQEHTKRQKQTLHRGFRIFAAIGIDWLHDLRLDADLRIQATSKMVPVFVLRRLLCVQGHGTGTGATSGDRLYSITLSRDSGQTHSFHDHDGVEPHTVYVCCSVPLCLSFFLLFPQVRLSWLCHL